VFFLDAGFEFGNLLNAMTNKKKILPIKRAIDKRH